MRRIRQEPEEATHHERWLVSYADLMTLLFALFVVLFASSYHDKQSLQKLSAAVKDGFQNLEAFPPARPASSASTDKDAANQRRGIDPAELHAKLNRALGKEIEKQEIALRTTPEGFVISLHELGFFDSGQAKLLPGASDKIKRIAAVLMEYGLDMRVEGHSDNVPIHNTEFPSNWELSTGRASAVAMMLIEDARCDPRRLSIAGYGQYHPAASNDTPEGRRANRRVDIVIVSADRPLQALKPAGRLANGPLEPAAESHWSMPGCCGQREGAVSSHISVRLSPTLETTMNKTIRLTCCAMLGIASLAVTASAKAATDDDKKFLAMASQSDQNEIAPSKLAESKATNPAVKSFAAKMISEHTKMTASMKPYADAWGLTPAMGPDSDHQKEIGKLNGLAGKDFDKQYIDDMVSDHAKALSAFTTEAKDTKDTKFQASVIKGKTAVAAHKNMAYDLKKKL